MVWGEQPFSAPCEGTGKRSEDDDKHSNEAFMVAVREISLSLLFPEASAEGAVSVSKGDCAMIRGSTNVHLPLSLPHVPAQVFMHRAHPPRFSFAVVINRL